MFCGLFLFISRSLCLRIKLVLLFFFFYCSFFFLSFLYLSFVFPSFNASGLLSCLSYACRILCKGIAGYALSTLPTVLQCSISASHHRTFISLG